MRNMVDPVAHYHHVLASLLRMPSGSSSTGFMKILALICTTTSGPLFWLLTLSPIPKVKEDDEAATAGGQKAIHHVGGNVGVLSSWGVDYLRIRLPATASLQDPSTPVRGRPCRHAGYSGQVQPAHCHAGLHGHDACTAVAGGDEQDVDLMAATLGARHKKVWISVSKWPLQQQQALLVRGGAGLTATLWTRPLLPGPPCASTMPSSGSRPSTVRRDVWPENSGAGALFRRYALAACSTSQTVFLTAIILWIPNLPFPLCPGSRRRLLPVRVCPVQTDGTFPAGVKSLS